MPTFVHNLEIRVLSPQFVVAKSQMAFTDRVIHALISALAGTSVTIKWRSNGRLEISFKNSCFMWSDLRDTIMPLLVNGRMVSRCPGEEGNTVRVSYVVPNGNYTYRTIETEEYPQFARVSEWLSTQRRLFGNNWDMGDGRYLHD